VQNFVLIHHTAIAAITSSGSSTTNSSSNSFGDCSTGTTDGAMDVSVVLLVQLDMENGDDGGDKDTLWVELAKPGT
jgi:hypothetical protein